jgi:HK97 family phage major capsid protein
MKIAPISMAAAALACAAYSPMPQSYFGATRNLFLGPLPVLDPPDRPGETTKAIEDLSKQLKEAADEVRKQAETTATEIKNLGQVTTETKKAADDALVKHGELSARMTEIEQKLTQRGDEKKDEPSSVGRKFTDSQEFKDWAAKGGKGRARVEVKAIISSLTTDADGSAGDAIAPTRLPGILTPPERRLTVRDLLTPGRTGTGIIEYIKESGFTNSAASHTETGGTTKPQSELKLDLIREGVTTIAHFVLATRQILSDVPMLQSYINGRLLYGLRLAEENQLLNGSGVGTDLNGIYTQATAYAAPIEPTSAGDLTKIDVIRLAILQSFLAELPASGIVLNPRDWADIELTKTDDGAYIFANPQGGSEPRLWRLPVVETPAMAVDKFLTGAFQLGAQIFDREDATVEASTEDSDNFRKNLVTILAEERVGLAVYRSEAFVKGDFSDALAA